MGTYIPAKRQSKNQVHGVASGSFFASLKSHIPITILISNANVVTKYDETKYKIDICPNSTGV